MVLTLELMTISSVNGLETSFRPRSLALPSTSQASGEKLAIDLREIFREFLGSHEIWPNRARRHRSRSPARSQSRLSSQAANPQIAKANGDAPVQAYIAAMPGWKRDVGRRLDAVIVRTVPV
jgi:hypothetical protein